MVVCFGDEVCVLSICGRPLLVMLCDLVPQQCPRFREQECLWEWSSYSRFALGIFLVLVTENRRPEGTSYNVASRYPSSESCRIPKTSSPAPYMVPSHGPCCLRTKRACSCCTHRALKLDQQITYLSPLLRCRPARSVAIRRISRQML